jgi:single-stranded DNA-binding protein
MRRWQVERIQELLGGDGLIVDSDLSSFSILRDAAIDGGNGHTSTLWANSKYGETNWYTVTTFRQLATNAAVSVKKGERIIVTGRLRIRDWESGGKTGTNVDVEAEAIGHDLSWGTAAFSRSAGSTTAEASGDSGIDSGHGQLSDQVGSALDVGSSTFPSEVELASSDDGQPLALVGASAGSGSSNEPVTPF